MCWAYSVCVFPVHLQPGTLKDKTPSRKLPVTPGVVAVAILAMPLCNLDCLDWHFTCCYAMSIEGLLLPCSYGCGSVPCGSLYIPRFVNIPFQWPVTSLCSDVDPFFEWLVMARTHDYLHGTGMTQLIVGHHPIGSQRRKHPVVFTVFTGVSRKFCHQHPSTISGCSIEHVAIQPTRFCLQHSTCEKEGDSSQDNWYFVCWNDNDNDWFEFVYHETGSI